MNNVYSYLCYHLVWATKNWQPLITSQAKESLYNNIGKIIALRNWHLLAIGGIFDHIHILLQAKQTFTVPDIVCSIKANSSKFMRNNFNKDFEWQKGYGIFSVDKVSISRLKNYIMKQEIHHKDKMTFQQELNLLIKRYNLD